MTSAPEPIEAANRGERYDLDLLDWAAITARLDAGLSQAPGTGGPDRHTCWLATIDPDGAPHVTGVGAIWVDGSFWFETGRTTRKGRNLARDPRCTVSVATHEFDLSVEGTAHLVNDPERVAALVAVWNASGWPAEVDASGTAITAPFSAPSAGGPPWHCYQVVPRSAMAVGTVEPGGATRWQFPPT